jgi:hypothetical protein
VLALGVGCYKQVEWLSRPLSPREKRTELAQVASLYEQIGSCCLRNGWKEPRIAFAGLNDALDPAAVMAMVFERQGLFVSLRPLLGGSIHPVTEQKAIEAVQQSDLVVIPLKENEKNNYPFLECMRQYRPRLLALCRQTLLDRGRFHVLGAEVALFARANVRVEGINYGWITDAGVTLTGDSEDLKLCPHIELRGRYYPMHLGRAPVARGELTAPGQPPRPVRARVTVSENEYRLRVDLSPQDIPDGRDLHIHLRFDTYFIPTERPEIFGATTDSRRLVLLAPDAVNLLPGP